MSKVLVYSSCVKKRKSIKKSFLDDIKGVGPKTKSRILRKFKTLKSNRNATIDELMTINGINEKIAIQILSNKK